MVSHLPFLGKSLSEKGSLVLRIWIIGIVFVAIPLILHGLITYVRDWQIEKREVLFAAKLLGRDLERQIAEYLRSDLALLRAHSQIQENNRENIPGLFYVLFDAQGSAVCSLDQQVGERCSPFGAEARFALQHKKILLFSSDPLFGRQQVYVLYPLSTNTIMALGSTPDRWLAGTSPPLVAALSSVDGKLLFCTQPRLSLEKMEVIPRGTAETGFWKALEEIWRGQEGYWGVKMEIPEALFQLVIAIPKSVLGKGYGPQLLTRLSIVALATIALGGIFSLWLSHRLGRPLRSLAGTMEQVSKGDLEVRFVPDKFGFEINALGLHFNATVDAMIKHMRQSQEERRAKELLAQELEIGREIQQSILPRSIPQLPGLEIGVGFRGARQVAGDFYDLFVHQGKLLVAIGDASGKGISACLYSLCARSILRTAATSQEGLSAAICEANNLLCADTAESGNFVTTWTGIIDFSARRLDYINSGHLPALLCHADGRMEELTTEGMAWGVAPFERVQPDSIVLAPGDLLLLYTDGVIEATNSAQHFFGKQRLLDIVHAQRAQHPQDMIAKIEQEVVDFAQGAPLYDDLTLVALRIE